MAFDLREAPFGSRPALLLPLVPGARLLVITQVWDSFLLSRAARCPVTLGLSCAPPPDFTWPPSWLALFGSLVLLFTGFLLPLPLLSPCFRLPLKGLSFRVKGRVSWLATSTLHLRPCGWPLSGSSMALLTSRTFGLLRVASSRVLPVSRPRERTSCLFRLSCKTCFWTSLLMTLGSVTMLSLWPLSALRASNSLSLFGVCLAKRSCQPPVLFRCLLRLGPPFLRIPLRPTCVFGRPTRACCPVSLWLPRPALWPLLSVAGQPLPTPTLSTASPSLSPLAGAESLSLGSTVLIGCMFFGLGSCAGCSPCARP